MIEFLQAQRMLTQMQQPLLAHYYGNDTGGDTFAHWIITGGTGANPTQAGRQIYDGLHEAGKDKILVLLRSHEVWNHIGGTPAKTDAFLNQFMNYDVTQTEVAEGEKG